MRRELENFKAEHKSHGEKNNDISLSLIRDFNTRGFLFRVSILMTGTRARARLGAAGALHRGARRGEAPKGRESAEGARAFR